jgi:8-oxo-dGTP pyrophosphatase MutT (NUDIX family)
MNKEKLIRRFSAGAVVFQIKKGKPKFLLLKREKKGETSGKTTKKSPKVEWILPKGEIEKGEKSQNTILREVQEEAGLKDLKIIDEVGKEQYFYRAPWEGNKLTFKIVRYFLIESKDKKEPNPEVKEGFTQAKWFTPEEVLDKITYKESKKILEQGILKIKVQSSK